jgi:thioredoxin reductase (NADPH)
MICHVNWVYGNRCSFKPDGSSQARLFVGAKPCTAWLDDFVARNEDGLSFAGVVANSATLLEADVPGVFGAGDVSAASTKRWAAAAGEAAMVVQLVHACLGTAVKEGAR